MSRNSRPIHQFKNKDNSLLIQKTKFFKQIQKVQRILKLKDTQANKGKLVNLEIILMYIQHHFLKISVRVRNNKENHIVKYNFHN